MMWAELTVQDMVLLGSVVLSWLAVAIALFSLLRIKRQSALTQQLYNRLSHNMTVANSGSMGMGQRLIALERKLKEESQQSVAALVNAESSSADSSNVTPFTQPSADKAMFQNANVQDDRPQENVFQPYSDATHMFDAGVDAEEVARRCGLSRAEASLMQVMHSHMKSADQQGAVNPTSVA